MTCSSHLAICRRHPAHAKIKRKHFESSAKRGSVVSFEIALGMSLTKSKNSKGPKIDPCGTPDVTGRKSDNSLSITTRCLLPDKYDLNQANKDQKDTRSKALEKSK